MTNSDEFDDSWVDGLTWLPRRACFRTADGIHLDLLTLEVAYASRVPCDDNGNRPTAWEYVTRSGRVGIAAAGLKNPPSAYQNVNVMNTLDVTITEESY